MGQVSWSTEWKTYYQDEYEKRQYKTGRLAYPTNGDRTYKTRTVTIKEPDPKYYPDPITYPETDFNPPESPVIAEPTPDYPDPNFMTTMNILKVK